MGDHCKMQACLYIRINLAMMQYFVIKVRIWQKQNKKSVMDVLLILLNCESQLELKYYE